MYIEYRFHLIDWCRYDAYYMWLKSYILLTHSMRSGFLQQTAKFERNLILFVDDVADEKSMMKWIYHM